MILKKRATWKWLVIVMASACAAGRAVAQAERNQADPSPGAPRSAEDVGSPGVASLLARRMVRAGTHLVQNAQDRTGERWGYFLGPDRMEVSGGAQVPDEVKVSDDRSGATHVTHFNPGPSPYTHVNDATSELCSFTRLVGERPGAEDELNPAFNCLHLLMSSTAPGRSFGDLHGASGGWLTQSLLAGEASFYGRGIHAVMNFTDYARGAGGDHTGLNLTTWIKPAVTTPGDEGHHNTRFDVHEEANMTGVVARGGRGATELAFTELKNGTHVGVGHPLIDRTSGVMHCTADAKPQNGGPGVVTLSGPGCRVHPSIALRLAVDAPVAPVNDGGSRPVVLTVDTAGCAAGSLVSTGGIYHEVARVLEAGRNAQGRPTVTVPLQYSHAAGDPVWCGGPVDLYLEQDDDTFGGHRYLFSVLGATGPQSLVAGVQSDGRVDGRMLRSGPVTLYHGALIRDVRVPGRRDADGSRLAIEENDAAWSAGDLVENTTHLANTYSEHYSYAEVFNPYAQFEFQHEHLTGVNGFIERQYVARLDLPTTSCASMLACGRSTDGRALLQPMALRRISNLAGGGDVWQYAPIGYGPQDHGFLVKVEAIAPGVVRHDVDLYQLGPHGDALTYNFETRRLEYDGSPICTLATGCGTGAGVHQGESGRTAGPPEGTPRAAFGPVAGTRPTGLSVSGRNDSMVIRYTSGAGSGGAGTLLSVEFSRAWQGVVSCQAAPENLTTAALGSTFATEPSASGFTIAAIHAKGGGQVSLTVQCR